MAPGTLGANGAPGDSVPYFFLRLEGGRSGHAVYSVPPPHRGKGRGSREIQRKRKRNKKSDNNQRMKFVFTSLH